MLKKVFAKGLVAAAVMGASMTAMAADCGDVSVVEMSWPSAEFAANLDKIILEEAFGCNVTLVPGAAITSLASMEAKGRPHIAPEFWANAVINQLRKAEDAGKVEITTKLIPDAYEGWYVSEYVADKFPELNTVDDVLKRKDLFPSKEDPSKGAFVNCPSGWSCQVLNDGLIKPSAYNLEGNGFVSVDPGSGAGLDGTIAKSYDRNEAWFGYYWQPSAVISKYELKKLDFVDGYDQDNWDNCVSDPECDTPKRSRFPASDVFTVVASEFSQGHPEIVEYLKKRAYNSDQVGKVLVYMLDNQADGETGAIEFLQTQEDVWTQWLSPEAVAKIKDAI